MTPVTTIYTKNRCVQCTQTKKMLKRNEVEFIEINIDENPNARENLLKEGWLSMPVVKTPSSSWSGFQPDKISSI